LGRENTPAPAQLAVKSESVDEGQAKVLHTRHIDGGTIAVLSPATTMAEKSEVFKLELGLYHQQYFIYCIVEVF
jgi:hypothetical protein